jgi:hypothetical protein
MHIVTIKPQVDDPRPGGEGLSPACSSCSRWCTRRARSRACVASRARRIATRGRWCARARSSSARRSADGARQGIEADAAREKLVWASHRINARLTPVLDTLASELEVEIERVVGTAPAS